MKKHVSRTPALHFSVVVLLLMILTFLQGCNAIVEPSQDPQIQSNPNPNENHEFYPNVSLRNSSLPDSSISTLLLEFSPNAVENPHLTQRIEREYGVLRRLLKRYGIDIQILNTNNVSSEELNEHARMTRLLKRYGITPQVLSNNNDQLTNTLLSEFAITNTVLASENITNEDIDRFNSFNALLQEHQTSVVDFVRDQQATIPEVDALTYTQSEPQELEVSLKNSILDDVLQEMSNDPDILRIRELN